MHMRKSFRSALCSKCGDKIRGMLAKVYKCRLCRAKVHFKCFTGDDMVRALSVRGPPPPPPPPSWLYITAQ